jgi:hypothetical protein
MAGILRSAQDDREKGSFIDVIPELSVLRKYPESPHSVSIHFNQLKS